jgi:hypothetical protein
MSTWVYRCTPIISAKKNQFVCIYMSKAVSLVTRGFSRQKRAAIRPSKVTKVNYRISFVIHYLIDWEFVRLHIDTSCSFKSSKPAMTIAEGSWSGKLGASARCVDVHRRHVEPSRSKQVHAGGQCLIYVVVRCCLLQTNLSLLRWSPL